MNLILSSNAFLYTTVSFVKFPFEIYSAKLLLGISYSGKNYFYNHFCTIFLAPKTRVMKFSSKIDYSNTLIDK